MLRQPVKNNPTKFQFQNNQNMSVPLPEVQNVLKKMKKGKGKGKKKTTIQKIAKGASTALSAVESLAPLLALAPAVLARHPAYQGHPALSSQTVAAPTAFGGINQTNTSFRSYQRKDRLVVESTDLIGQVEWVQQSAETHRDIGTPLFAVSIDPYSPSFNGTRIQLLARGYQQWELKRASFLFVPMAPTTAVGALAMMSTTDPDEMIESTGLTALKSVMAHDGASEFPLWMPAYCHYKPIPGRTFYSSMANAPTGVQDDAIEAGLEARQTSAGQIAIFAASDLYPYSDGTNQFYTYGQVIVKWIVEFFNPAADDLSDTLFWGGSITAAQGATVTAAQPFGDPSATGRGWTGWNRPIPVTSPNGVAQNNLDITLGDSGRVYGFPVGYYFGWFYGSNLTGALVAALGGSTNAAIEVQDTQSVQNTAATSILRFIWFIVWQPGDNDVQDFQPFKWTTAPTGIGNDDFRMAFMRVSPIRNAITDSVSALGNPLIIRNRLERRKEAFRRAVRGVFRDMFPPLEDVMRDAQLTSVPFNRETPSLLQSGDVRTSDVPSEVAVNVQLLEAYRRLGLTAPKL